MHGPAECRPLSSTFSLEARQDCQPDHSGNDQQSPWMQAGVCFRCWWFSQEFTLSLVGTIGLQTESPEIMQPGNLRDSEQKILPGEQIEHLANPSPGVWLSARLPGHARLGWSTKLNNLIQANKGVQLRYVYATGGPAHRPVWTCTANGMFDVPPSWYLPTSS